MLLYAFSYNYKSNSVSPINVKMIHTHSTFVELYDLYSRASQAAVTSNEPIPVVDGKPLIGLSCPVV
jgi:hypothetical protein